MKTNIINPLAKVLKEEHILKRYKIDDISKVKKLNLWGLKLTDIEIIKKMPQLEVLSLSSNKISTIQSLKYCSSLTEIYLRNNNIKDISELLHLKDLSQLKILWIGDNPCCSNIINDNDINLDKDSLYRAYVINHLPQIQVLDNIEITENERLEAEKMLNNFKIHVDIGKDEPPIASVTQSESNTITTTSPTTKEEPLTSSSTNEDSRSSECLKPMEMISNDDTTCSNLSISPYKEYNHSKYTDEQETNNSSESESIQVNSIEISNFDTAETIKEENPLLSNDPMTTTDTDTTINKTTMNTLSQNYSNTVTKSIIPLLDLLNQADLNNLQKEINGRISTMDHV